MPSVLLDLFIINAFPLLYRSTLKESLKNDYLLFLVTRNAVFIADIAFVFPCAFFGFYYLHLFFLRVDVACLERLEKQETADQE